MTTIDFAASPLYIFPRKRVSQPVCQNEEWSTTDKESGSVKNPEIKGTLFARVMIVSGVCDAQVIFELAPRRVYHRQPDILEI